MVRVKRIYEEFSDNDGYRVLVDRLWPRGVSKEKARIDIWMKEVGPSNALRQWFNHDPAKWPDFQKKYRAELRQNPAFEELKQIVRQNKTVTLLYSAKDQLHNQAVILKSWLG